MKHVFKSCIIVSAIMMAYMMLLGCSNDNATGTQPSTFEKDETCNENTDCWQPDTLFYYKLQCRLTDEACDYLYNESFNDTILGEPDMHSVEDIKQRLNNVKKLYCPEIGYYNEQVEFTDTVNIYIPNNKFRVRGIKQIQAVELAKILYSVTGVNKDIPEIVRMCKLKSKAYRINPELSIDKKDSLNNEYTIEE